MNRSVKVCRLGDWRLDDGGRVYRGACEETSIRFDFIIFHKLEKSLTLNVNGDISTINSCCVSSSTCVYPSVTSISTGLK